MISTPLTPGFLHGVGQTGRTERGAPASPSRLGARPDPRPPVDEGIATIRCPHRRGDIGSHRPARHSPHAPTVVRTGRADTST